MVTDAEKIEYLVYRIQQAQKEIEDQHYVGGGSAYRHLDKALVILDFNLFYKTNIVSYERAKDIEKRLLDEQKSVGYPERVNF